MKVSVASQKYLAWFGVQEKVQVEMSTTYGEKKIGDYRVDGFVAPCTKYPKGLIIEFFGCYYHGHKCRYSENSFIGEKRVGDIREKDEKRIKELEKHHPVEVVWECEMVKIMKKDQDMREFFESYEPAGVLQCEKALVGGRTEVFRLFKDNKALEKGYKVIHVYHGVRYLQWAQMDPQTGQGGLFTSYINQMMEEKIYSSGWPAHVKSDEQKKAYVEDYREKEQIFLNDLSRFVENPGKRAAAKLMLNSLWGKFAQKVDRTNTSIFTSMPEFWKMFDDKSVIMQSARFVNDTIIVEHSKEEEALESLRTSAIHLAAYTTSHARLRLYRFMELVGDDNIVYTDTDSIVYAIPEGADDPLHQFEGPYLGQLTDELAGTMTEFVTIGPKTYAYKETLPDGTEKVVRKAKGFSLNTQVDNLITFDLMKKMVEEMSNPPPQPNELYLVVPKLTKEFGTKIADCVAPGCLGWGSTHFGAYYHTTPDCCPQLHHRGLQKTVAERIVELKRERDIAINNTAAKALFLEFPEAERERLENSASRVKLMHSIVASTEVRKRRLELSIMRHATSRNIGKELECCKKEIAVDTERKRLLEKSLWLLKISTDATKEKIEDTKKCIDSHIAEKQMFTELRDQHVVEGEKKRLMLLNLERSVKAKEIMQPAKWMEEGVNNTADGLCKGCGAYKNMSGVSNESQERLSRYNEELDLLNQRKDELRREMNTLSTTVNEIEKEQDSCRSELSKLAKESTTLRSIAFEAETRVRREEEELRRLLATKTRFEGYKKTSIEELVARKVECHQAEKILHQRRKEIEKMKTEEETLTAITRTEGKKSFACDGCASCVQLKTEFETRMAKMMESATNLLHRYTCPVCLELYEDVSLFPQTLPCGHTVCNRCRGHLKSERIGLDRYSTCPVCRQPFNVDRPYPAQDLLTNSPSFIHFK
ncbi:unnamed protein product [Caenorhabditis sp. 36 PRJEB53466]|nr:unnamed protein product [Caenorhabditis sp. 36 PRJEB53466]